MVTNKAAGLTAHYYCLFYAAGPNMMQNYELPKSETLCGFPIKEIKKTNRKTRDSGGLFRKDISKYCWTHGACGHTGKECRAKAPGHRDDATLENRNGGSNARCPA